jgi:hypothetical protein
MMIIIMPINGAKASFTSVLPVPQELRFGAASVAALKLKCELLRDTIRAQASLSDELSLRSGALQARSVELSLKSRTLRQGKRMANA